VAPLTKERFRAAVAAENGSRAYIAELVCQLTKDADSLVFVNGRRAASVSPRSGAVRISSLHEAYANASALIEAHLTRYADYRRQAFVALNTAFLDNGAFVYIPDGTSADRPIHLVYISVPGSGPQISHPRNLIIAGAGSRFSLIETYAGIDSGAAQQPPYFTNAVTEIVCGKDAAVDHYKLQQESDSAFHIATLQVQQGRGSNFRSHSLSFGGALTRNDVNAVLEHGSECTLRGLYAVGGQQHVDTHTSIDHAKPHAVSHELYKGVLNGHASAVFNGKIIVRIDAQKTDARQTNKNLVLSEGATINTKPELQIYADDVRCTHGATVGQLDEEAIFYLQSRGIGRENAREMLTHAFAREVTGTIQIETFRNYVEELLASRLAKEAQ
ncbi:MAG: Fe-S cluster assembly protein SufD, partial [Bryobacteraceae bacterium]